MLAILPRLWLNLQEFLQPLGMLITQPVLIIFSLTYIHELCSQAVSMAVRCSHHNLIALRLKCRSLELGMFTAVHIKDLMLTHLLKMLMIYSGLIALKMFIVRLVDEHAPLWKRSVKNSSAAWIVGELWIFNASR